MINTNQTVRREILSIGPDQIEVASIIFDRQESSANVIDALFTEEFAVVVAEVLEEKPRGIILSSAKSSFFAGGDLNLIAATGTTQAAALFEQVERLKASLRALETSGIPVVACIEGPALGGGWEIALACHARFMLDQPHVKIGLPEVTLGLLPGGGGVIRTVRSVGLQAALPLLTEGRSYRAQEAQKLGLIHSIASDRESLWSLASDFISAHPQAQQPWDQKGYRLPGGSPSSPKLAPMLAMAPAMLHKKTQGVFPAPEAILSVMIEGALVDFETAMRLESRAFVKLVCDPVAKNMISTFWYQLNEAKSGVGRPAEIERATFTRIGILGAGMMGAGIAYAAASVGIEVVLKDLSQDQAERGKSYSERLLERQVKRGRRSIEEAAEILARITPTDQASALAGCELVVEAVFEDRELKAQVTAEAERFLSEDAIFATNTSTLPITGLAEASARPAQMIGLHFFSPVDKMKLVEIICGRDTSDATLARAYDLVLQLKKIPIIVKDRRGFFTSRVFGTYTQEGIAMLGEGVHPAMIENAAALAGFPVGPLAVSDEVSLSLMAKIRRQEERDAEASGESPSAHPAHRVIDRMLALGRSGRAAGGGFYDYPTSADAPSGKAKAKKLLWSGLTTEFPTQERSISLQDVKDRLLLIMTLETIRCFDEGVLTSERDANLGSIFGIGFPAWTGGASRFVHHLGAQALVDRAEELRVYGERFIPPESLRARARAEEA